MLVNQNLKRNIYSLFKIKFSICSGHLVCSNQVFLRFTSCCTYLLYNMRLCQFALHYYVLVISDTDILKFVIWIRTLSFKCQLLQYVLFTLTPPLTRKRGLQFLFIFTSGLIDPIQLVVNSSNVWTLLIFFVSRVLH